MNSGEEYIKEDSKFRRRIQMKTSDEDFRGRIQKRKNLLLEFRERRRQI